MRIPSASAFQLSANFLSSSPAISMYIDKIGPELSIKPDSPCDALFGTDRGGHSRSPILSPMGVIVVVGNGEDNG